MMKPFIRLGTLGSICVVLLTLATSGMAVPPADHTADEHGFMHANDKDLPYSRRNSRPQCESLTGKQTLSSPICVTGQSVR